MTKTGPKDQARPADQYEYVFENQIDFITDAAARGEMVSLSLPLVDLFMSIAL